MSEYKEKYLRYKRKYLELKQKYVQMGGNPKNLDKLLGKNKVSHNGLEIADTPVDSYALVSTEQILKAKK